MIAVRVFGDDVVIADSVEQAQAWYIERIGCPAADLCAPDRVPLTARAGDDGRTLHAIVKASKARLPLLLQVPR